MTENTSFQTTDHEERGVLPRVLSSQAYICILGTLLNTVGSGIFYVMPVYSDAVSARLHISGSTIGLIDSLETASLAIAAVALSIAAGRVGSRTMVLCCVVASAGNLLVGLMPNAVSLGVLRFLTGLLGEGPLCAYSYVVLSRMTRPERGFGVSLTSVALFSAVAMRFTFKSPLTGQGDSLILLTLLSVPAALLLLGASYVEPRGRLVSNIKPSHGARDSPSERTFAGVIAALAVWAAAPGVLWPFATQVALQGGALVQDISSGIAISPLIGLLGSALPVLAGRRVSYRFGALLATCGLCASSLLLPISRSALAIALCLGAFIAFWSLAQVYQTAIVARIDKSRRGIIIVPAVQSIGMASGTALASLLIDKVGMSAVPVCCAAIAVLATPAFLIRKWDG